MVFLALAVSDEIFLKLLGVGMATAIFLDATVVRIVLVPALMQLLGPANWWIPHWLDRRLPASTSSRPPRGHESPRPHRNLQHAPTPSTLSGSLPARLPA